MMLVAFNWINSFKWFMTWTSCSNNFIWHRYDGDSMLMTIFRYRWQNSMLVIFFCVLITFQSFTNIIIYQNVMYVTDILCRGREIHLGAKFNKNCSPTSLCAKRWCWWRDTNTPNLWRPHLVSNNCRKHRCKLHTCNPDNHIKWTVLYGPYVM